MICTAGICQSTYQHRDEAEIRIRKPRSEVEELCKYDAMCYAIDYSRDLGYGHLCHSNIKLELMGSYLTTDYKFCYYK